MFSRVWLLKGQRRISVLARAGDDTLVKETVYVQVQQEGEPPPPSSCAPPPANHTINLCAPADGTTVSSPVRVWATAFSSSGVSYSQVYVDGVRQHHVDSATVDVSLTMAAGTRRVTVQSKDNGGVIFKRTVYVTVR